MSPLRPLLFGAAATFLLLPLDALAQGLPAGSTCTGAGDCHSTLCSDKVCLPKLASEGSACSADFAAEDCASG